MRKKLLFCLIFFLIIGATQCSKRVQIRPTKSQKIFFQRKEVNYPVRIGLINSNRIIHFSATSDFKVVDAINDSLLKMGKANEKWLCIFPETGDEGISAEVWRLQIGAFRTEEASNSFLETVQIAGQDKAYVLFDNGWFKVRVGNFRSREEVLQFKQSIAPKYSDSFPVKISFIPNEIGEIEIVSSDKNFVKISKSLL